LQIKNTKDSKCKAGWDTHGLPVELGTEGIRYYKRRYRKVYFIEEYNEACKTVMRYTDVEWSDWKWGIGLIWKIHMWLISLNIWKRFGGCLNKSIIKIWCTKAIPFSLTPKAGTGELSWSESARELPWCNGYDCCSAI
jgi:hypothetical protein